MEFSTVSLENTYMAQAKAIRDLSHCAKQKVGAVVVSKDGTVIGLGNNDTTETFDVCPRDTAGCVSGQGYEMCHDICGQNFHAETAALVYMGSLRAKVFGSVNFHDTSLYLYGHWYCCANCLEEIAKAGITRVYTLDGVDKAIDWSTM